MANPSTFPHRSRGFWIALVSLLPLLAGCHSLSPRPPLDFSGPDWMVREGQAVWRANARATGIAGELLVATHPDGRSVVRFTKTPLPFLIAQRTTNWWQMQFVPRNKTYGGPGQVPIRVLWLHLAEEYEGRLPYRVNFDGGFAGDGGFSFWNLRTGESVAGYLNITRRPAYYVIRPGDSLAVVAKRLDVTVEALRAANPEARDGRVLVGQTLQIPPLSLLP